MSFPRVVARFGVSDRVDVGALGGLAPRANYGLVGVDSRIALLKQGPTRPVSVSVRPSITLLLAPSELLVGNAGIDLSVSRAIGPVSPYAGVAVSTSGGRTVEECRPRPGSVPGHHSPTWGSRTAGSRSSCRRRWRRGPRSAMPLASALDFDLPTSGRTNLRPVETW